jgi:hypothetical protein
VVGNLARQFRPEDMVVVGAKYLGCPPQTWQAEWPKLKYATIQPPDGLRGARWIRWAQMPVLLLRALWTMLTERCKAIVVVFPDEIFLLVGYLLSLLTRKPLYPYLHNTYLENRPNSGFARWLQPRVFARSRHVFVMSEGMQRLYNKNYPGLECSPLLHSFNDPLPDPDEVVCPPAHKPLRLVLFGNISASNAEATVRLVELIKTMPDVHLTLFSGTSRAYLKQLGFNSDQITVKTVSHDVLMDGIREGDIIVLPHGFYGSIAEEEIATIFPTRTIEALISERPILAHTPDACFLTDFLRRHDCALIVEKPDVEALRQAIERLRVDEKLRRHLVRQALITARQFQASTVADHLRRVLLNENHAIRAAEQTIGSQQ